MKTSKQHLNQATTAPLPCPEASIGNPAERAQESHPVTEEVSRDFSKIALAAELVTALTYDDRKLPRWHGHVGHAEVNEHSLLITRSYASPREGANQERLVVSLTDGRVHLRGFDEGGKSFSIECPLSPEAVMARMHGAGQSHRHVMNPSTSARNSSDAEAISLLFFIPTLLVVLRRNRFITIWRTIARLLVAKPLRVRDWSSAS